MPEDERLHLVELRLKVALRAALAVPLVGPLRAVATLALPRPRRAALGAGRPVHLVQRPAFLDMPLSRELSP